MLGITHQSKNLIKWSVAKEKKDIYLYRNCLQCYSEEPFSEKYRVACLEVNGIQSSKSQRMKCIEI